MAPSGKSVKRSAFATSVARADRQRAGRTWAPSTPLAVRTSGVSVDPEVRDRIHRRLGWRLGKFAPHIERVTVRFKDVNGPRGGHDVACTIKVVMSGLASLVVTELSRGARDAFDRAGGRIERVVRRALDRARGRDGLGAAPPPSVPAEPAPPTGVGDAGTAPAPRNFRRRPRKATVALEASARPRPSRKSTRGSANRAKHANPQARREQRRAASPKAKRSRSRSRA